MQDAIDFLLNLNIPLFWMIGIMFILAVIHPIISQPGRILTVTVARIWFVITIDLVILLIGYLLGIVLY